MTQEEELIHHPEGKKIWQEQPAQRDALSEQAFQRVQEPASGGQKEPHQSESGSLCQDRRKSRCKSYSHPLSFTVLPVFSSCGRLLD
jgi:hypothetical protein